MKKFAAIYQKVPFRMTFVICLGEKEAVSKAEAAFFFGKKCDMAAGEGF